MTRRDLFFVVADLDAEVTVRTLLTRRQPSLGIRLDFDPTKDLLRFTGRDSGCFKQADVLLRPSLATHRHAIVLFDWHGSGAEPRDRVEIEEDIERKLGKCGWPSGDAVVIVIDPELENWVWAQSSHVPQELGWGSDRAALRKFLESRGLWDPSVNKPAPPKESLKLALREKRRAVGAPLFQALAETVSFSGCEDPAFQKLSQVLKKWFPAPVI